jgi:hypothetical protein
MKTIVVTCAKYEQVARALKKNLEHFGLSAVFISDRHIDVEGEQLVSAHSNWGLRLAHCLRLIEDDFVFFMLDDYFITHPLSTATLTALSEFIELNQPDYVRLVNVPKMKLEREISPIESSQPYMVNLQPAIWRRAVLMEVLEESGGNPWETEVRLQTTMQARKTGLSLSFVANTELGIFNGVIKGKWKRNYRTILADFLPPPSINDLRVMSASEELSYNAKRIVSESVTAPAVRAVIKRVMKVFGVRFFSEDK